MIDAWNAQGAGLEPPEAAEVRQLKNHPISESSGLPDQGDKNWSTDKISPEARHPHELCPSLHYQYT